MMKRLLAMLAVLLLAACGGNVRTADPVRYDFGSLDGSAAAARLPLAAVNVQAASWLAGPAMYFRLAYAEPLQRRSYVESRWAAPPAELLAALLKRRLVFAEAEPAAGGCRLQLVVDELEQRFDDPQQSFAVLDVRAQLMPRRGAEVLARRTLHIQKPAPTPDARGGAAATRDAAQALAVDLAGWLADVTREKPAIVERCKT